MTTIAALDYVTHYDNIASFGVETSRKLARAQRAGNRDDAGQHNCSRQTAPRPDSLNAVANESESKQSGCREIIVSYSI